MLNESSLNQHYCLKQGPRQWFHRSQHTLHQLGFASSTCNSSLFIYRNQSQVVYFLVYVDDIIITGTSTALIQSITQKLHAAFSLKELGELDYFLGPEVKYLPDSSLIMTQTKYIIDLLHKTNIIEAHPISSPMATNCKVSKHGADLFSDRTL